MSALDLLSRRFAALAVGDFAAVYASYCEDAPFLQQFSDRGTYLRFARQQLAQIEVQSWRSLRQRVCGKGREEHLLVMTLAVDGRTHYFYELALLIETPQGWRYHSAQKLSAEDYAGPPEQIDFRHFDAVSEKIRF